MEQIKLVMFDGCKYWTCFSGGTASSLRTSCLFVCVRVGVHVRTQIILVANHSFYTENLVYVLFDSWHLWKVCLNFMIVFVFSRRILSRLLIVHDNGWYINFSPIYTFIWYHNSIWIYCIGCANNHINHQINSVTFLGWPFHHELQVTTH